MRLRCWNIPEHRGEVGNVEALEIAFAHATCPSGAFIDEERIAFGFLVLWHLTIAAYLSLPKCVSWQSGISASTNPLSETVSLFNA